MYCQYSSMHLSSCLIVSILVLAVIGSGCTAPSGPASPPVSTTPLLTDLALNASELPTCFSFTQGHTKTSSEVGTLARDLGWENGYVVTFTCPEGMNESTVLVQSIAIYPAENMQGIAAMVNKQDRQDGFTYQETWDPDQRVFIHGFYGTSNQTQSSGISDVMYGDSNQPEPNRLSGYASAEFVLFRKNVFEVVKMTGPGTNATVIHDIARTAAMKIP